LQKFIKIEIKIIWFLVIIFIFFTLIAILFYKFKNHKIDSKELQIGESISIKYKRDTFYRIKVFKLLQSQKNEKLEMTWETFGKGLENLKLNINNAPAIAPNIIFGINEIGIMAASYLSRHFQINPCIGIIKTSGKLPPNDRRLVLQFDCPRSEVVQFDNTSKEFDSISKPHQIAIVDNEIKTGKSIKWIIDRLKKIYGDNIDIIYIVLCGVLKEGDEDEKIHDTKYFGWDIDEAKYKPDFMAFYINSPGERGPGGLR